jgi:N6-adenosine-specific RNA methylase IME4
LTKLLDPPWDWSDEGDINQLGRAKPDYTTMTIEELCKLPVGKLSDNNCHLYLWVTNRSLPKAFKLIEQWGFRYITCITWVKPSFGMGNYFRGSTEQLLFAVKGSQPLKRKDVGTHFLANRGKYHSSKPDYVYGLIESCSYGPYLEMFSRNKRENWTMWGESYG